MSVDQHGGLPRGAEPFAINDRVPLGFDQLGLDAHRRQLVANQNRRPPGIGIVIGLRTDTGNPDQILELLFEDAFVRLEIIIQPVHGHGSRPFPVLVLEKPRGSSR